ncbi:conserved hypothetical protein [Solidesulfovibrio fructosivorans JJ]]|uniref:Flavinylation-associated cytochrome domain-containing protein n=1 Tax=Solidesulfovibrio fructosivorans JJ] TaxID=596151 RepID=E1JSE7_SOLFR|nr:DUF4405 domain-containing protein [Solidesulfovibrio fructosivorans]EFL52916.1 conserved hypothetical protein [Solidesulfovibrio fructosivorans JJ]]
MFKKSVFLILLFSFFLLILSALVVFIAPAARVASWADWAFLGLSRPRWEAAHLGMGLLFAVAGLVHVICNRAALLDTLRDADGALILFTRPFFVGLVVAVGIFVWSLGGMPPVGQLVAFSDYFKQRAVETYGEPPYAEAQRSTLESLARRMGMDKDKALALLRLKNIKAESADMTLAEIARQNGVAPGGVFEALRMVMEPSGGNPAGLPKDPPPGLGRRKLSDICEEYGLPQATAMARLVAAGMKAQPSWTLTETAKANNVLPIAVYEALRTEKPAPVAVEVTPTPETTPSQPVEQESTAGQPAPAEQPAPAPAAPQQAPTAQPAPGLATQPGSAPTTPGTLPPAQPGYPPATAEPAQPTAPAATIPATAPPGLEKMMLQTFCREYDIPLSVAVQRLARHHITAFGDMSFEELSLENNRTPTDIMRLVVGQ